MAYRKDREDVESRPWARYVMPRAGMVGDEKVSWDWARDANQQGWHWYWASDGPELLYPQWHKSGEPPERVLFYHMRPDEWDHKIPWSRYTITCGEPGCINPFHAEFIRATKSKTTLSDVRRLSDQGMDFRDQPLLPNQPFADTVYIAALAAYLFILSSEDIINSLVDQTGNLIEESDWYTATALNLSDPRVHVELEKLLRADPLMTEEQAEAEADRAWADLKAKEMSTPTFRQRLAAASGIAPHEDDESPDASGTPLARPARSRERHDDASPPRRKRVKPKPRKRG